MQKITRWIVPLAALFALGAFIYIAPPGLLGKADAVGYAICHRIDERSFHIGVRQLPMCARDTGTFTSAGITLLLLTFLKPKRAGMPAKKIIFTLIAFFLFWAFDGANSYLYLIKQTYEGALSQIPNAYMPNNTLRLITGTGMGMGMGSVLYAAFNQTAWKKLDMRPALKEWRELAVLVGTMFIVDLAILSGSSIVLYPIALISVLGVITLLSLIFSVVWMMIMRQENSFTSLKEMWIALTAGFTLALIMLIIIDILRFRMTGTWGAFPM